MPAAPEADGDVAGPERLRGGVLGNDALDESGRCGEGRDLDLPFEVLSMERLSRECEVAEINTSLDVPSRLDVLLERERIEQLGFQQQPEDGVPRQHLGP